MDNGLIFPYRRRTAHTNPVMLTIRDQSSFPSGEHRLVERGTRSGAVSVLTGVTQEGSPSQAMVVLVQACRPSDRQIRRSSKAET